MQTASERSRREFLSGSMGGLAFVVGAGGLAGLLSSCSSKEEKAVSPEVKVISPIIQTASISIPELPWQYVSLEPVSAAERGYQAYYNGGCMFGAFEGIVGELREKVGFPYTAFPVQMMRYGKAGVAGWGTLCGALNGASAAIYLVADPKAGDQIIDELYNWYGKTALPNYEPLSPKFQIKASVADSPLCHNSVTRWCETTGLKALSPERAERCGWLTASVARFTVDLLNKQAGGVFVPVQTLSNDVKGCLSCHGKGGAVENVHASKGITCEPCHTSLPPYHQSH